MDSTEKLHDDLQHGNDMERYNAAVMLGARGDKRAAPVLREFLTKGDYWLRAQAVQLLGRVGDPADIPAMVEVAIAEGDYEPRMPAAQGLNELDADGAARDLIEHLSSENPRIRRYAAETLGYMQASQAVPHLISVLQNDPHKEPKGAAASALGDIGDTSAVPALIEALRHDTDARFQVIHALGQLADRRAVPALLEIYKGRGLGDWGEYSTFAEALGQIGDPAGVEALISIVENIKDLVRDPIRDAGDQFSTARAVVYQEAVEALGRIGDIRAVDPLLQQLDERRGDAVLRTPAIAEALGIIGDRRAVEPLIEALTDDYWNLRIAAAETLGSLGDTRAVRPLIQMLTSGEPLVGQIAAQALERIGTPDAMAAIKKWQQREHRS